MSHVDPEVPNPARIYDYLLGGKNNFASDRRLADQLFLGDPYAPVSACETRAFTERSVAAVAGEGVGQFLDIGCGLPAKNSVDQIARAHVPGARVVYVDNDPVVVRYMQGELAGRDDAWVIEGDLRRPRDILERALVRSRLDFAAPVCVVISAVLHFVRDSEQPGEIVQVLAEALAPGSYVIISHATLDWHPEREENMGLGEDLYESASAPFRARPGAVVAGWLEGLDILPPGPVSASAWRPPAGAEDGLVVPIMAAVAVKPGPASTAAR